MITEINYSLEVYGVTWGGFRSCYSYTLSRDTAEAILSHGDDTFTRRSCGDFSDLIDWRLVKCTHEYEKNRRTDTYKTLRGFRNGMRPTRFYRIANGG